MNKALIYFKAKKDPALAVMEFINEAEKMCEGMLTKAVDKVAEKAKDEVQEKFDALKEAIPALSVALAKELKAEVYKNPDRFIGRKGNKGDRGEKGDKGDQGIPGKTPKAGEDYPDSFGFELLAKKFALKEKDIIPLIEKILKKRKLKNIDAEKIARALEALEGGARLDFNALKNTPERPRPNTPQQFSGQRGGGGTNTTPVYYDLSDQCDGSKKVFTIPSNSSVIWVAGSDAPSGQYRKTTDWTGTGTTTLTLTDAVAAPLQGATLHILYIPA